MSGHFKLTNLDLAIEGFYHSFLIVRMPCRRIAAFRDPRGMPSLSQTRVHIPFPPRQFLAGYINRFVMTADDLHRLMSSGLGPSQGECQDI
jgi:hypothetical protein